MREQRVRIRRSVVPSSGPAVDEAGPEPERPPRRSPEAAELRRDTNRIEAFSDGVFAVAITLLVLDLAVPPHPPGGLLQALLDLWPAYVAYLASFIWVGVVWVNHHGVFKRIKAVDRGLFWVNLLILVTVVATPFPTAVLATALREGNAADSKTAVVLYALTFAFNAVAWFCFFAYVSRRPQLLRGEGDAHYLRVDGRRAPLGVVSYAIAAVLGYVVDPLVALVIFVILPIFYGVTSEGLRSARAIDDEAR